MEQSLDGEPVPRPDRLPALDGMRAIACLLVLTYHSFQFTGIANASLPWGLRQVTLNGNAGVDIFIVLSGFCLFLPIARAPERFKAKQFARARVRRLVPAYYASIGYVIALPFVLKFGFRLLGSSTHAQRIPSLEQLITHIFFVHTFYSKTWDGINGSYWTLGLEAQFYVLLPLIAFAFRRKGAFVLIAACAVGLVTQLIILAVWPHDRGFVVSHFLWSASVLGRLTEFGAGMLGAWFVTNQPVACHRLRWLLSVAPLLALAYMLSLDNWTPPSPIAVSSWALTIGLTLVGCANPGLWYSRALRRPGLAFLGLVSYSFYLIHQPTVYYVSQFGDRLHVTGFANWGLQLTVGAAIVLVLSLLSYRFLERPFIGTKPAGAEARLADRVFVSIGFGRLRAASSVAPGDG